MIMEHDEQVQDRVLTIQIPADEDASTVIEVVQKLVEQGYTSGIAPEWDLSDSE